MIELLIVIFVMSILAATVFFALGNTASSAAVATCNSDAKTVEVALKAFHYSAANQTFDWPKASPAGNAQLTDPASAGYGGPYLSEWPTSAHYSIAIDANGNVLVNGQPYDGSVNPCSSVS